MVDIQLSLMRPPYEHELKKQKAWDDTETQTKILDCIVSADQLGTVNLCNYSHTTDVVKWSTVLAVTYPETSIFSKGHIFNFI